MSTGLRHLEGNATYFIVAVFDTHAPSKSTTESSTQGRTGGDLERDLLPYTIYKTPAISLSKTFSHVSSTPNLRPSTTIDRGRKLRRSHSAESMGLPKPLLLSPLQVPSIVDTEIASKTSSEAVSEGLRLSRFPAPPRRIRAQTSQTDHSSDDSPELDQAYHQQNSNACLIPHCKSDNAEISVNCSVELRVQQPTLNAASRPSTSKEGMLDETSPSTTVVHFERPQIEKDDDSSRCSIHLQSMRISHHLRSGSLLSWDKLASAPELQNPPGAFSKNTTTDSGQVSKENWQRSRHDRQTSSSGIASSKIPTRWGRVLSRDTIISPDSGSSIYSYRPQSLPDSLHGSMGALPGAGTENQSCSISSSNTGKPIHSTSFSAESVEMPTSTQIYGPSTVLVASSRLGNTLPDARPKAPLARKNSVAETKVSKFREEFSPPAPKRKLAKSSSLIKFLNATRLGLRSQSDPRLRSETPIANLDGPSDMLSVSADRERRQSQSLLSLRTEQQALGKNRGADSVWDRALLAHQEEKASLFLVKNKDLAVHASPFRERSGSISTKQVSADELNISIQPEGSSRRLSTSRSHAPDDERCEVAPTPIFRRSALWGSNESGRGDELLNAYERQGDGIEVVGAWGRYPSHTRQIRAGSAGKADNVQPRDFALEAAVNFTSAIDDEDMIDPTQRRPSTPLQPGEKKKKRRGGGRIRRSSSMTLSKALMKNYTKMFKSQSTEYRRHGRGHRSSIASGGILEHPELELLPEVWSDNFTEDTSIGALNYHDEFVAQTYPLKDVSKGKSRLVADDPMARFRSRRNSSAPNLSNLSLNDGAADSEHLPDGARIWSVYYKSCVDTYPPLGNDGNISTQDLRTSTGLPLSNQRGYQQSSMLLGHPRGHSRNASGISHVDQGNNCISSEGDGCAAEVKSLVSVRRSTMDLISQFQEQELQEHERILTMR